MRKPFVRKNRRGATAAIAMIFIVVLVAIGAIVGLVAMRDQLIQEFGDVSVGLDSIDQSYSYNVEIDSDADGMIDFTYSGQYNDNAPTLEDPAGAPPAGITFVLPDSNESPVTAPTGSLP